MVSADGPAEGVSSGAAVVLDAIAVGVAVVVVVVVVTSSGFGSSWLAVGVLVSGVCVVKVVVVGGAPLRLAAGSGSLVVLAVGGAASSGELLTAAVSAGGVTIWAGPAFGSIALDVVVCSLVAPSVDGCSGAGLVSGTLGTSSEVSAAGGGSLGEDELPLDENVGSLSGRTTVGGSWGGAGEDSSDGLSSAGAGGLVVDLEPTS